MLTNVPFNIGILTRNIVINHPNTFNCSVWHMNVTRAEVFSLSGNPTMGGLGVLDEEDEEQYEYVFAGNGYALPVDAFTPAPMVDHNDANIGPADEFRFLIEPEAENSGEDYWFTVSTHDIVQIWLGEDTSCAKLAFEVVGRETTTNIPPYNVRYVCNRRDDLHLSEDETEDDDEEDEAGDSDDSENTDSSE